MIDFIKKIESHCDSEALCINETTYTYSQLIERIYYFTNELQNIDSGSVVSLISDYSFDAISLFLALAQKKCVIAPIVSEKTEEIRKRESAIEPDVTINLRSSVGSCFQNNIVSKSRHDLLDQLATNNRAGLVLFSSGSTGSPKAMIHDLDNLFDSYLNKKKKTLSIIVFLMFDHIGGLNTLLNSLSMGSKIIIPGSREPEHVAELIEREKVNLLPASPTFLNMMLIADVFSRYNVKSLRLITYGTEAMPESLLHRLKKQLPKVKLLQTFGTSETGIAQTSSRSSSSLEIKIEDPNQEYKVINGELWLKSKTQILGYLNHDMSSFTDDGWFKTGDLVEEKENGYLKVVGRIKEVINVGGEKVLPSEVESCVLEVEGVMDCVVFSIPNAITGQTVAVNVVLTEGTDSKQVKKRIRSYCRSKLDKYKIPTKINFTEDAGVSERFKKNRLVKYKA